MINQFSLTNPVNSYELSFDLNSSADVSDSLPNQSNSSDISLDNPTLLSNSSSDSSNNSSNNSNNNNSNGSNLSFGSSFNNSNLSPDNSSNNSSSSGTYSTYSTSVFYTNTSFSSNSLRNRIYNLANSTMTNGRLINLNGDLDKSIREELNKIKFHGKTGRKNLNMCVNKYLAQRSYYGNRTPNLSSHYGLQHLISNNLFKEDLIDLGRIDKIYSSCWLNDEFVLCGTKCNKLILINLNNKKHYFMPVLDSRFDTDASGGLYSIAINPSKTMLATGTRKGNDIAIYKLPSLDVLYLLEKGHSDFIFDIKWLDDHYLLSGSKDSSVILWKVDDSDNTEIDEDTNLYKLNYSQPIKQFNYTDAAKIRCLNFNKQKEEIAILSLNAKLHIIDPATMGKKKSTNLPQNEDLVCLTHNEEYLYAIGSKSHVQFIDSRTLEFVSTISSINNPTCGVRSLSFNSNILTIGAGNGNIQFYDLRNSRYFTNQMNHELILKTSRGWIEPVPIDQQNIGYFSLII